MSKKTLKPIKKDITFTLDGMDGPVEYNLTPMTQKVAAHTFHNCLASVIRAVAKAVTGETSKDKMAAFIAAVPNAMSHDEVWFVLGNMLKHAIVDDEEIGSLDQSYVFDVNPHHMYQVLFYGVQGNWPDYFSKLGAKMGGFVSRLKQTMGEMAEMGKEEKEDTDK